jgi:ABC-type enterochelin transport system substrate-binding protein
MPAFSTMRTANAKTWPKLLAVGKRIVDGQTKFEKLVTVDPFEAEKLAAEIATLYAEIQNFWGSYRKEVETFGAVYKSAATKVYALSASINKTIATVSKAIEQSRKDKANVG